jgi:integrase
MEKSEEFENYLRNNTPISEGSIASYLRIMKFFFKKFQEPTIENLNLFVNNSFRKSRSYHTRYAVRYWLYFTNRASEFPLIVKIKIKPKKRLGTYLTKENVMAIINGIGQEKYRDIAKLQFAVGARAREILTMTEENIDFSGPEIKVRLIGKGDKARVVYLLKDFEPLLKKYCCLGMSYLFFPKEYNKIDAKTLEIKINSERTRYYNQIKKVKVEFGTHDFRRNVAELLRQSGKDLHIIKEILGHSNLAITEKYFKQDSEQTKSAMLEMQK